MSKKRLFVAINLPDNVKKKISDIVAGLDAQIDKKIARQMGFRWLPPDSWHLTISFLGLQPDESITSILRAIKETAKIFSAPEINFDDVVWAPSLKAARMIWVAGSEETSEVLSGTKNKLEDSLIDNGVRFKAENRKYNTHLTLARFASAQSIDDLNVHFSDIARSEFLKLSFMAKSIDLMESETSPGGAKYFILSKENFSNF